MLNVGVVTLFPEMFRAVTEHGVTGRAVDAGRLAIQCWNPRDYTQDRHRNVDDSPYGGGPGMVMQVAPVRAAIAAARAALPGAPVIYLSPQGRRLDQAGVETLAPAARLILLAGRYEGIDERLIELEVDAEWSIGDYVLSGGELPAMVMIDALARRQPGVVGDAGSVDADSFATGLLDYPHYTRPESIDGRTVPEVLLSGDHERIRRWRLKQALGRTWQRRPELIDRSRLSAEEQALLDEFLREQE
ncbi:tRNA (guanine37-N1)-methyltransferase [Methylohalomonas lacus]|uniref:tRNA (guanine-N(1)-)-methyltransferase n=1 Tax=Methylohalomonas lacus TaxID=398773 RepID=A0AAE3HMA4_9GAMM|nr:tRNA (guanine37-N1)-methyltransferase [Methylohalomonas lacus]